MPDYLLDAAHRPSRSRGEAETDASVVPSEREGQSDGGGA